MSLLLSSCFLHKVDPAPCVLHSGWWVLSVFLFSFVFQHGCVSFAAFPFDGLFEGLVVCFCFIRLLFFSLFFLALMAVWSSLFTILVRRWCQSSFAFGFPFARANLPVGPLSFPFLLWGQVTRCCFSPICFLALVSLLSLVYLLLPAFVLYCL